MQCIDWLHCIVLHCFALHCIALIALHCIALWHVWIFFVGYPEISQWPLDFITRFHAHVLMNVFTFAFAYDMFGIFCDICGNQSMTPRFYYSDSCTCERPPCERQRQRQRQTDTDRQSDTDRQTDRQRETEKVGQEDTQTSRHKETTRRQTDKRKDFSMSHPFSPFPFHAKPGLTRLGQGRRIWRHI